jgi:CYTH domain-containing protein
MTESVVQLWFTHLSHEIVAQDGPVSSEQEWRRTAGAGRYAQPERERRFLVAEVPALPGEPRLIEDRYLDGTRLRLRRLTVGSEVVLKLTQKVRTGRGPGAVALTNIYLDGSEYGLLSALPGAELVKTRYVVDGFAFDVFAGALTGLVLAEIEVDDLAGALELPSWIGSEVTNDERYAGASLARGAPGT